MIDICPQTELQHRRSVSGRTLQDHVSGSGGHKRPVSIGVCHLNGLMSTQKIDSDHEFTETVKMFSGDEKDHHQLHTMILKGSGKLNPATVGPTSVLVKMRLFTGLLQDIRDQHKSFFTVI